MVSSPIMSSPQNPNSRLRLSWTKKISTKLKGRIELQEQEAAIRSRISGITKEKAALTESIHKHIEMIEGVPKPLVARMESLTDSIADLQRELTEVEAKLSYLDPSEASSGEMDETLAGPSATIGSGTAQSSTQSTSPLTFLVYSCVSHSSRYRRM
jgi:hypothetical protein